MLQLMTSKNEADDEPQEEEITRFSSLDEFRPLTYRYHLGPFSESWFACAVKNGEHFILKIYHKGERQTRLIRVPFCLAP